MSAELVRVRSAWERHEHQLPCTEGDAEVVSVFESFFMGRGESLVKGKGFGDLVLDYGAFVRLMKLDVYDFDEMLTAQPDRVLLQLGVAVDLARSTEARSRREKMMRMKRDDDAWIALPSMDLRYDIPQSWVFRSALQNLGTQDCDQQHGSVFY